MDKQVQVQRRLAREIKVNDGINKLKETTFPLERTILRDIADSKSRIN